MKLSVVVPAAATAIYVGVILFIVYSERAQMSGGFITLRGMGSFLFTFPSSMLFEYFSRFDVMNNLQVGVSMVLNAALIYALLFGVLKLFHVK